MGLLKPEFFIWPFSAARLLLLRAGKLHNVGTEQVVSTGLEESRGEFWMRFGRRHWDAWCLRAALILSLGGIADCVLSGRFTMRALAYPCAALPLVPVRFWISVEGEDYPTIQSLSLSRQERFFYVWCVLSFVGILCVIPVVMKTRTYWWAWALFECAFLAVTFWMACRVDRARRLASAKRPE
jgi:hypothetical protein